MAQVLSLHAWHEEQGAHFGAWADREVVLSYGDPLTEYQAARSGAVLVDLSAREVLELRGEDRLSFLHGMVTQDVKGLPQGRAAYCAFLTAKGAMVADGRIVQLPDRLLVDVEPGRGSPVMEFLEKHLISEDVTLTMRTDLALLGVRGPRALERLAPVLGAAAALLGTADTASTLPLPDSLATVVSLGVAAPLPGVDLLVPLEQAERLVRALMAAGVKPLGMDAQEWLRVEAGVPRYGVDMDEKTIPLEANLQRALHYQKGCYIGQEVVVRATYRGHMNRKLVGLLLGERGALPRTELRSPAQPDKKVGYLTSVVHSPRLGQYVSLGYVHRDFLAPGTALTLAETGAQVQVAELPLVSAL